MDLLTDHPRAAHSCQNMVMQAPALLLNRQNTFQLYH